MKKNLGKIIACVLAVVMVFAMTSSVLANNHGTGNIQGKEYDLDGAGPYGQCTGMTSNDVSIQMDVYGDLYGYNTKAVALQSPSIYCTVNRVRAEHSFADPITKQYYDNLRIDPNASSNFVKSGGTNKKHIMAVQAILCFLKFYNGAVDGIAGPGTVTAIKNFQQSRGLGNDGIVGANTWRALCSSKTFKYGYTTW